MMINGSDFRAKVYFSEFVLSTVSNPQDQAFSLSNLHSLLLEGVIMSGNPLG